MIAKLLTSLRRWLSSVGPDLQQPDLIFCHAGRDYRKPAAVRLYEQRRAKSLLLSVGRFEVRRLLELELPHVVDLRAASAALKPRQRRFFVLLRGDEIKWWRIPVECLGTLNESRALASWLREHPEIGSVLVVTSFVHLRRVSLSCRALLPSQVHVGFCGVEPDMGREAPYGLSALELLTELSKLLGYMVLLGAVVVFRRSMPKGGRS